MALVVLYLTAVVLANITVALFGPGVTIINALVFIALDLTSRDALHERWHGKHLWLKMFLLILSGSLLSAILNANAAPIALASFIAFLASESADAVTYTLLGNQSRRVKVNGSNVVSAAVDSLCFPILAFGFPVLWGIVIGQFVAKTFGGYIWSLVLIREKTS